MPLIPNNKNLNTSRIQNRTNGPLLAENKRQQPPEVKKEYQLDDLLK
jgi:hypothetical protein